MCLRLSSQTASFSYNQLAADPQEIIEFACAALSLRTLELVGSWRTYVKPTHHPRLSEFCVGLTGINQADVDAGVGLASALDGLVTWLRTSELLTTPADGDATERFVVCTWTDWDMERMLHGEAKWRRIELPPFLRRWVDLKSVFGETFKSAKGFNLAQSCASAGVAWDGRAHSGLDDARNTARLAAKLVERGAVLRPTGAFAGFEAPAPRQKTLAEAFGVAPPAPAKPRAGADGSCACGVAAKLRKVQRPGPNCGRCFYSCGAYTQRKGAVCDFFEWASADTVLPDEKGRRRRRSTD